MRLIKAKLRGFIGIKEGLGLDEVEVNFEGLEGLVALEGANGMGKTTLLRTLAGRLEPAEILENLWRSLEIKE